MIQELTKNIIAAGKERKSDMKIFTLSTGTRTASRTSSRRRRTSSRGWTTSSRASSTGSPSAPSTSRTTSCRPASRPTTGRPTSAPPRPGDRYDSAENINMSPVFSCASNRLRDPTIQGRGNLSSASSCFLYALNEGKLIPPIFWCWTILGNRTPSCGGRENRLHFRRVFAGAIGD